MSQGTPRAANSRRNLGGPSGLEDPPLEPPEGPRPPEPGGSAHLLVRPVIQGKRPQDTDTVRRTCPGAGRCENGGGRRCGGSLCATGPRGAPQQPANPPPTEAPPRTPSRDRAQWTPLSRDASWAWLCSACWDRSCHRGDHTRAGGQLSAPSRPHPD